MKIALVHELLTMRGGAERVLKILAEMFPDAPIYTLLYNKEKLGEWFPADRVRTPQYRFPYSLLPKNHHLFLKQFPKAIESWPFDCAPTYAKASVDKQDDTFDLVISTSSAFVHGIITNGNPKHLCYVNSPARYLWDRTHDVLNQASKGPFGFVRRRYLERLFHTLRIWDSEAADRPDQLLAASKEIQRRVELYWRRDSDVLYPPIDDWWFESSNNDARDDYYLIASTLVPYKRIDLAIEACNKAEKKLKIVGEGPALSNLKRMAGPTVEFLGYKPRDELKSLFTNAKAVLFPGDEDFGLVPVEAMACGTPVIGYRKGGALETIVEGETGEFFNEPTADAVIDAMNTLEQKTYNKDTCKKRAQEFSRKKFEAGIRSAIERL